MKTIFEFGMKKTYYIHQYTYEYNISNDESIVNKN